MKAKHTLIHFMFFILNFIFFTGLLTAQMVVINEVMSSNSNTIYDEDGDSPDWIEFYNSGINPVSLNNFGISDDIDDPFKWIFPDITIPPQEFLLIFASSKDRALTAHWETFINWGDIWKYFVGVFEPPADWRTIYFDDSNWLSGPSGLGYGDDDDATIIPQTISFYIRHTFNISDVNDIISALFHVDYDDSFVAYLNNVEIARANIGLVGFPPPYDQLANSSREALIYQGGMPECYIVENIQSYLQTGENVLAIQVHNCEPNSSDMTMIPFLTFGMTVPPASPQGVPPILEPTLPHLHTNFKISSTGETLTLTDGNGQTIDQLDTGYIPTDVSLGRQPDGSDNWLYFTEATPETSNITNGFQNVANDPQFSVQGGFYDISQTIYLSGNSPAETIYYTLDGSEPTDTAMVYTEPIIISVNSVVRARTFGFGEIPSRTITHSYFFDEDFSLPVISISTTPANFWDEEFGIYALGNNAQPDFPYFGANFWEDWERPINIEFYEQNGDIGFNIAAGVKIFGGWSRGFPQKSLSIFARNQYGYSEIDYQIFDEKPISQFEAIVLRNSGNDWLNTNYRDAMMTGLLNSTNLDRQAYRPAIVFLNAEYWGIYNVREKVNEHFLASNNGVDSDNLDLLESYGAVIQGDEYHYFSMVFFIENNDLTIPANYEYVKTLIDVDNFMNYQVVQIYFDNEDWPGNNIKYWRERTPQGKWKWIIFDTDFGFGLWNPGNYANNTLAFALEPNGPNWPNPPWSTFLLRSLMDNDQFKKDFINCFADHLNCTFIPDRVVSRIDSIQNVMGTEMSNHMVRWEGSMADWYYNVQVMRNFANNRIPYVHTHIINEFDLPGTADLTLNVSPPDSGRIQINSLILNYFPWTGTYFQDNPITLTAIPDPGYQFTGWFGNISSDSISINVNLTEDINVIAVFEPIITYSDSVVFNEINYNSAQNFNPEDWVEIYNCSSSNIDISEWEFKDSEDMHIFTFPENFILESDEYFVLCRDTLAFITLFPDVTNYIGDFDFGLSGNGELIRLFDNTGSLIDSVLYDDNLPWPPEPDGNGPTLSLLNPFLNNSLPGSWAASNGFGTPGEINDVFTEIDEFNVSVVPSKCKLYQNYPNPFNPTTTIKFNTSLRQGYAGQAENTEDTELTIYNIKGQKVKTFDVLECGNRVTAASTRLMHSITWNGTDENNKPVGSGIYFYSLKIDNKIISTKKCLLLK